jgi:hypothetical protein
MSSAQTRSQLERPPRAFRSGRVPGETLSAISYSAKQPAATGAGCSFERGGGGGDGGGGDGGDGDGRGGEGCGGEEGGGVGSGGDGSGGLGGGGEGVSDGGCGDGGGAMHG